METIAADSEAFEDVKAVRIAVFVNEQGVPADEEFDEDEDKYIHIGWRHESGLLAGVCRLRPHPPFLKLERVAVLKSHRMFGAGSKINKFAIEEARRQFPGLLLVAHAQSSALPFYLKLGFVVVSKEFLDDVKILHHTIIYPETKCIADYDLLRNCIQVPAPAMFVEGEYNDPTVMSRILDVLHSVKETRITMLDTVMQHVDTRFIGGGVTGKFLNLSASVLDRQSNIEGMVYPLTTITDDEEFLIGLAWDKLNTGHYSEVDERWRRFYFAISFVKSIRLKVEKRYKESLKAYDMGLLMGSHFLPDSAVSAYVAQLARNIPVADISHDNPADICSASPERLVNSVDVTTCKYVPSDEDFLETFLLPSRPVLLKGAYAKWDCKAIRSWTIPYLHQKLADRTFPVEIGSKYTEDDWSQKLMTGNEFFTEMYQSPVPMYLAQHRLLDQVVDLKEDIVIPPYCFATGSAKQDVDVNVWIGPHGTVSPLHTDPKDNLFVQISGKKFVRLISPGDTEKVYANQDGILTNTSQIDVEHPDSKKFPLFSEATVYDVQVDAGDVLFIPKGWWHYVRSLSPSISLSFWFINDLVD